MEGHIANHCKKASSEVIWEYLQRLSKTEETFNFFSPSNIKKRKSIDKTQTSLKQLFNQIEELTLGYINQINRTLLKFFICCEVSFQIVKNLFFVDLI